MKRALLLALSCAIGVPAAAQPAPDKTAEEHYEASKKLYNIEKYDEAIAELKKAYELSPDPIYLFNIGQALRKKNDCAGALDYYRKYLRDSPNAPNKDKVEGWMTELEACAKVEVKPIVKPIVKPVEIKPVEAKPKITGMVVPDPKPIDNAPSSDGNRTLRIAGLATAGVGVGVLVAGVVMGVSSRSIANQISEECAVGCDWPELEQRDAKGHKRATLSKIEIGVGGVMIAGGVVMYFLGRATGRESRVAVVPTDGGGFVVTGGRF